MKEIKEEQTIDELLGKIVSFYAPKKKQLNKIAEEAIQILENMGNKLGEEIPIEDSKIIRYVPLFVIKLIIGKILETCGIKKYKMDNQEQIWQACLKNIKEKNNG